MKTNTRRDMIVACVKDLVADLLYYDRKEHEDLPVGSIEEAIDKGEISAEEIVAFFKSELYEHVGEEVE